MTTYRTHIPRALLLGVFKVGIEPTPPGLSEIECSLATLYSPYLIPSKVWLIYYVLNKEYFKFRFQKEVGYKV